MRKTVTIGGHRKYAGSLLARQRGLSQQRGVSRFDAGSFPFYPIGRTIGATSYNSLSFVAVCVLFSMVHGRMGLT